MKCCVIEPVPGPCAANSFCDWRGSGTDCAGSYKPGMVWASTSFLSAFITDVLCVFAGYCPGPSNFECCDIFG